MNSPFTALFKISLSQSFDFRKKDKVKNASLLIPLLLILVFGSLLSLLYSFLFAIVLKESGSSEQMNLVLYAMTGFASMLALMTGITKVKGTLFGGNDYDMLASLPIPKKNIIFVKFFSLYLVQLFYSFVIIFPATLVVCVLGRHPLWLIDGVLLILFSPIVPLLACGVLGTLIGFVSNRFKFGNIISVLFYLVFLGAIMYSSFMLNSGRGDEEASAASILQLLSGLSWINPTTKILSWNFSIVPYIVYGIVNLLILVGLILLFAGCYDYFHFLLTSTKSHQKYIEKASKQKGQFKALFMLDVKRYFSSKMYMMNTITGGIVCILCTVIMIISFTQIQDPEAMVVLKDISPYFVLLITWCIGMAVPSSVSINMEGKTMWQVKSLPISYQQYAKSKILLSYLILAPFILIASSILTIYIEKTVITILTTFLLPQVYLFSMCCLGFFINSYFYKLKWSNETEAVKNSAGALISMLFDFAYTIVLCLVLIVPGVFGYFIVGAILSFIVVIGMALLFYFLVSRTCKKNITSIEI